MRVLLSLIYCRLMSSRQLDKHLAILHGTQSPPTDDMNHPLYWQFLKHSVLNALPIRDSSQVVILMASSVVSAVILIESLFISLSLFLHPCVALVAGWLLWCKLITQLAHLCSYSVWSCSSLPLGLFVILTRMRCHGCSHHGGTSGN